MSQPSIEKLDRNFVPRAVEDNVEWFDIRDLGLEGKGFVDTLLPFDRMPAKAQGHIRENAWILSRHSAGIACRFVTDAPKISARWKLINAQKAMDHMPATGVSGLDLYSFVDGVWRWAGLGIPSEFPSNSQMIAADLLAGLHEFLLYLPLYNAVESVQIGIPQGSTLARTEVGSAGGCGRSPLVFYGTSIVQGGCASRSGMGYPETLGRQLRRPTFNLGLSGSGPIDVDMAPYIASIEAACYILDPIPNTREDQMELTVAFVEAIRKLRPTTPILLVESIVWQHAWARSTTPLKPSRMSELFRAEYAKLLARGVNDIYYLPGANLLGDDGLGTVDGVHPTDLGFLRMAKIIGEAVGAIVQHSA